MRSSSTLSLVTHRNNAEELVCTDCTNKFFCSFDGLKKIEFDCSLDWMLAICYMIDTKLKLAKREFKEGLYIEELLK